MELSTEDNCHDNTWIHHKSASEIQAHDTYWNIGLTTPSIFGKVAQEPLCDDISPTLSPDSIQQIEQMQHFILCSCN